MANYYVKELFPNTGRLLPGRRGDKRRDWLVVGPEDEVDLVDYLETGGPDGEPMIPVVLNGAGAAELTWTLLREKPYRGGKSKSRTKMVNRPWASFACRGIPLVHR